ncbi:hypothetical protein DSUL_150064 [Desulfovibrionales bacterium]
MQILKKRKLFVPVLGEERNISAHYTLDDARHDIREIFSLHLQRLGVYDPSRLMEITEASVFNVVDFYGVSSCNIRVKCQIQPGIIR